MSNLLHDREQVDQLISTAMRAPSVHNTQPWRFVIRDRQVIELHADSGRRLPVLDPRGRSMVISCGAALLNLRLAMLAVGTVPEVVVKAGLADGATLLAEIGSGGLGTASEPERRLHAAIARRRSNRLPFEERAVPENVLREMTAAARLEGTTLRLVSRSVTTAVLDVIRRADTELAADPQYRAELDRWTADGSRLDGVPRYAFGVPPGPGEPPMRDFGLDWWHSARPGQHFERRPHLAALVTTGDAPRDWMRAGQGLQHVLLTATAHGLATSLLSQPLDLEDMRFPLPRDEPGEHIQAIIRFGYGPSAPASPRRPVTAVLDET